MNDSDKKINIAICLSGEPRNWELGADSIKIFKQNLENYCNIDVFYHFWDDVTKRQRHLIEDPIYKKIDSKILLDNYTPTVGVCAPKSTLDPHIDDMWNHIQEHIKKYNFTPNQCIKSLLRCTPDELAKTNFSLKEAFYHKIKTTNSPPFSQLVTVCKSLLIMLDYAESKKVTYDIIIKSRSDVIIKPISIKRINSVLKKEHYKRYIKFPSLSTRTPRHCNPDRHTPHVDYSFFVGSSHTIKRSMFNNYSRRLAELLIQVNNPNGKASCFIHNSSHNCMPRLFKDETTDLDTKGGHVILGAPCTPFGYKLQQMDYDLNSKKLWE
tara:strand:+ start:104 stop:1075 length:972 start_codon:yes stop_codon:yes gene_type:complete